METAASHSPQQTEAVCEVSVLMPCLNEAETLGTCINKAKASLKSLGVNGEVIIADNGSTDGSQEIARSLGARVVNVERRGYGNALMRGIATAHGKYVIMGDSDDSYDFTNLGPFMEKLRAGYDLVMGNRFMGNIHPGAMPPLHRYLGNPVLTAIGRLFFKSPSGDFHCGLRSFRRQAILDLDLRTTGMEFASEMVVKSSLHDLRITEVPTILQPDGRSRPPHLRSWHDGWRHLRFLLLYSPRWLFLYPGMLLIAFGLIAGALLLQGPVFVGSIGFDAQTLLYAAAAVILGFQAMAFGVFTKVFAISEGLLPEDPKLTFSKIKVNLERGLIVGVSLILTGLVCSVYSVWTWKRASFGILDSAHTLRIIIPAITALIIGVQIVFSSFFLSVLGLRRR
ncbi:MAG: dolichol-P-glucose synthetase [Cyanobacteria bacterium 13_1_20CM_4_61_6]|nr:MAG: dolichol-P-glucose synthetase [Cyanobacteria bacterium 13_1_20CM_4_61_6]